MSDLNGSSLPGLDATLALKWLNNSPAKEARGSESVDACTELGRLLAGSDQAGACFAAAADIFARQLDSLATEACGGESSEISLQAGSVWESPKVHEPSNSLQLDQSISNRADIVS